MIVGVNKYRLEKEETNFDVLKIDNSAVRDQQCNRLKEVREKRDEKKV